ncbi:MAG TPA: hypothetical protein VE959_21250 [Bryobacteraceae bacterium]|nr:hypothetical protein [Bryobacteraceae bacterium]
MAWLRAGDFVRGFAEYTWRHRPSGTLAPSSVMPAWDGSPLAGRTILIRTEHGFGDILQFIRFAPLVKELGGTVLVKCPPALTHWLARCTGIDTLIAWGTPAPPADVEAWLLDLPAILDPTPDCVPAQIPYVFPDRRLVGRAVAKQETGPGRPGNQAARRHRTRQNAAASVAPAANCAVRTEKGRQKRSVSC